MILFITIYYYVELLILVVDSINKIYNWTGRYLIKNSLFHENNLQLLLVYR
jgi:hypothetical protein